MLFGQNLAENLSVRQRAILLPIVNIVCVGLAMFLKDIQAVLGIGGALGGCLVVFAFPSLCRLWVATEPRTSPKMIGHIALVVFGVTSAAICCYYSVLDAVASFRK
jgi:hypothetical protein